MCNQCNNTDCVKMITAKTIEPKVQYIVQNDYVHAVAVSFNVSLWCSELQFYCSTLDFPKVSDVPSAGAIGDLRINKHFRSCIFVFCTDNFFHISQNILLCIKWHSCILLIKKRLLISKTQQMAGKKLKASSLKWLFDITDNQMFCLM